MVTFHSQQAPAPPGAITPESVGELSPESPGGLIPESVGGFAGILTMSIAARLWHFRMPSQDGSLHNDGEGSS